MNFTYFGRKIFLHTSPSVIHLAILFRSGSSPVRMPAARTAPQQEHLLRLRKSDLATIEEGNQTLSQCQYSRIAVHTVILLRCNAACHGSLRARARQASNLQPCTDRPSAIPPTRDVVDVPPRPRPQHSNRSLSLHRGYPRLWALDRAKRKPDAASSILQNLGGSETDSWSRLTIIRRA